MPPKKRGAAAPAPKKKSRSSIAKSLNLSGEEEEEIRAAFDLFVGEDDELGADEIETGNVKKALRALGFSFTEDELDEILGAIDSEEIGTVNYEMFLEVCALKIRDRDKQEEVDKAYNLFTGGTDGPITLAHLKRVARVINENVSEETLKDMLMEASTKDRMRVDRRDFEGIMQRAGML